MQGMKYELMNSTDESEKRTLWEMESWNTAIPLYDIVRSIAARDERDGAENDKR